MTTFPKRLTLMVLGVVMTFSATAQTTYPYQNTALTPEQRADDLIGRLTLEEKARLMIDVSGPVERLGIKPFQWWNETLHGVARNGFATVFPITMGMAASWDDALLFRCFDAASDEARIKYRQAVRAGQMNRYQGLSFWTPNINIFRDPRWGRGQETYGEDPYLTTRMGLAVVRGLEGPKDAKYKKLLSCAKHYAVHSGRNGTATRSTSRTCLSATCGKPISQRSRRWCRRVMWRRSCAPISASTDSLAAVRHAICSRFSVTNGVSRA